MKPSFLMSYCSVRTYRRALKKRILSWSERGRKIVAIVEGSDSDHIVFLSPSVVDCSCWGFITHSNVLCSHIVAVLQNLLLEGREADVKFYLDVFANRNWGWKAKMFLKTSLKNLNELFITPEVPEGGLPIGILTEFYGFPESGKSIMVLQLAYETMKALNTSAILVDTEGGLAEHMIPFWKPRFDKRYQINAKVVYLKAEVKPIYVKEVKEDKDVVESQEKEELAGYDVKIKIPKNRKPHTLYIMRVGAIEEILAIHGHPIKKIISESGKLTIKLLPRGFASNFWRTPMYRLVDTLDAKYIAYDSVSSPLDSFGSYQENFPARSDAAKYWLTQAQNIAEDLEAAVVGTFHASRNPAQPRQFAPPPEPKDGLAPAHRFKYVIYMEKQKAKAKKNLVKIVLKRHSAKAGWEDHVTKMLKITDEGFFDV